jgi:eukaryotic-like serine/threonine-protein kinase
VIRKVYELRLLRQRLRVRGAILFMEYVPGYCLADSEYVGSMEETLRVFLEVANGLQAMHHAGYVHADMKPNNILLTPDNQVKLIDLGQSAKIHEAKVKVQGTIDYMAPEQVKRGVLDQRTDVFGLGAALHKVLTGNAIATEMNQTAGMHAENLIGRRVDETRAATMKELPVSVTRLVNDCCRHDPDDRIFDMTILIERLEFVQAIIKKQTAAGTLLTGVNVNKPDANASMNPDRADDSEVGSEDKADDSPE